MVWILLPSKGWLVSSTELTPAQRFQHVLRLLHRSRSQTLSALCTLLWKFKGNISCMLNGFWESNVCFSELQTQFDLKAKLTSLLMKSDLRALAPWKALPWGCGAEPGGSPKAPRWGWGAQGCPGGAVPSPPNQTHPTDPSKASWARLDVVLGVGQSPAIPRHCGAHQESIPWKGMGWN